MEVRENAEQLVNELIEGIREMDDGKEKNAALQSLTKFYSEVHKDWKEEMDVKIALDKKDFEEMKFKAENELAKKRLDLDIEKHLFEKKKYEESKSFQKKVELISALSGIGEKVIVVSAVTVLTLAAWYLETKGFIPSKLLGAIGKIRI